MLFKYGSGTGTNLSPIRVVARAAERRRHGVGPGLLHARLRRLRRRHQVGRQDPPRRQDGHPQRRPPRRRRVHQVQGQGREEGLGADRRRLRRLVRRRGVQVRLLPELEQLGARHRRLHGGGAEGPRLARPARCATARPSRRCRRADLWREIAEAAWQCGDPGLQYDTTINAWHTSADTARINASNPCSRVHVPRRLGLQPGVAEPAQVRAARGRRSHRRDRRRVLPPRGRDHHPGAGDHRRQRQVPDASGSRRTRTGSGRSAWATRTSARC